MTSLARPLDRAGAGVVREHQSAELGLSGSSSLASSPVLKESMDDGVWSEKSVPREGAPAVVGDGGGSGVVAAAGGGGGGGGILLGEKGEGDGTVGKEEKGNSELPPDGGYGWVCVVCCALINGHTWGLNSSYGVFLAYYLANNTFAGATYLDFAFIGGLSIACALLTSPIGTITTREYGSRTTLLIGVFFETLSLIGASFAHAIWHLFLTQGACFGIGMGFLFVGSVGILPQWFTTRRSLANGIGAAGSGFGGLVYSLAANAMIERIGLAWAFRVLGIVSFLVNFVCACLVRDRNRQIGTRQLAFDYRMFRRPEFTLLQGWGFFSMLGYIVLLFSLPNYANKVGLTAKQGSLIGAMLNLGQGLGRPPIGYFSDSVGRINMAMLMTFLSGLFALVIWIFAKGFGVLIFYALIGGSVAGTFWATIGPVGAEVIGLVDLPSCLSITWLVLAVPCAFSEAIALEIVKKTSTGYLGAQVFAGFMYIAAAGCLFAVRIWKLGDMEREAIEMNEKNNNGLKTPGIQQRGISSVWNRMIRWKKV